MVLERLSQSIYAVSKYLVVFLVGLMSIVIIAQVLNRTFFGSSFFWSEELARYCLVWITFIGVSIAVRNGELVMLDFIQTKLTGKWKKYYQFFLNLIALIFMGIIIYYGFKQTFAPSALIQVTPALRLPMWVVYICVPIGFIFSFIHIISSMVLALKMGKEDR
ncbi:TRAP transporter small permease [Halalkalibacterium ligniniphilum]|uniref:TRAP transporter small permease n=1 Tax=Halalkalibacterium ligniniphilum TaxID=1134413 RepID=UPI00034748CB|nr:TRAP transporter small permease [Halalkalibacterium ligniniphilum]